MTFLVDSNVLLRAVQSTHPTHAVAVQALQALIESGIKRSISTQNAAEFWNVLTRPVSANGLGLSLEEAAAELARIELSFPVVHETDSSFSHWKYLLAKHRIQGVSVHDARLVSVMLAQNITHILTFDTSDFARYPEITAIHPAALAERALVLP